LTQWMTFAKKCAVSNLTKLGKGVMSMGYDKTEEDVCPCNNCRNCISFSIGEGKVIDWSSCIPLAQAMQLYGPAHKDYVVEAWDNQTIRNCSRHEPRHEPRTW